MSESNGPNGDPGNGNGAAPPVMAQVAYPMMDSLPGEPVGNGLPPALSSPPDAVGLLRALGRKWIVAVVLGVIVGAGAAAVVWFTFPTYYSASALIRISAQQPRLVFQTGDQDRDFELFKKTQRELVTSPDVLRDALSRVPNEVLQIPEIQKEMDQVKWLRREIRVGFPGEAELMQISMSSAKREIVAPLVNAVKDAYLEVIVHEQEQARHDRKGTLEGIVNRAEDELRKDREYLRRLSDDAGAAKSETLAAKHHFAMERYTKLWQEHLRKYVEVTGAQIELELANQRLAAIESKSAEEWEMEEWELEARLNSDPVYQARSQRFQALKAAVQYLEETARNPNEPVLVRRREALSRAEEELSKAREQRAAVVRERLRQSALLDARQAVNQLEAKVGLLKQFAGTLYKQAQEVELEAEQVAKESVEIEFKRAEMERKDRMTERIRNQMEELSIELDAPQRIVAMDDAVTPKTKDTEKRLPTAMMAGVMGFCCVTALVTWWEYRSRRIGTSAELSRGLQMKVLGSLPNLRERSSRRFGVPSRARDTYWQWRFTESVQTIRTVLLHAARRDSTKVVLVTSAMSGEGKTTLATHLGMSLAAAGKRVLVVDGDTRDPTLHNLFDVPMEPGLSDALSGATELGESIHPTPARNLWVLTGGRHDAQAVQSLSQDVLGELVGRMRESYDFVLIDSPPVLSVSDALVLGQRADVAILATMQDVSRLPLVYEAYQRLTTLGVNVLGAVINGSTDDYKGVYLDRNPQLAVSEA